MRDTDVEPETIAALLARAERSAGDTPFTIDAASGRILSYRALAARARLVAATLDARGVARGERVAIAGDNGAELVAAMLGAMIGGYVGVPLNPRAGPEASAHVLAHADVKVVLRAGGRKPRELAGADAAALAPAIVEVDALDDVVAAADTSPAPTSADDVAWIVYTSGTSARPKGVVLTQRNLVARARDAVLRHALGPDDRLHAALSLAQGNALGMLLGVLASGGSLVLPQTVAPATYWDEVIRYRCTWLTLVPTLVAQLLALDATPARAAVAGVRFARCSSAALADEHHRAFEARFGVLLVQGMGTTETGGIFLNPLDPARRRVGAIGHALGYEVRVTDEAGLTLPDGEVGELRVRGPAMMRGYHRDDEATARVLDADGWLRLGDRAYRDDDGLYVHAGRVSDLVIKAGVNIAPREIEDALAAHPDVAAVAVIGVPHATLGEDLAAFVVRRGGASVPAHALQRFAEARVGAFKVPGVVRFVAALPETAARKIDRRALARLYDDDDDTRAREARAARVFDGPLARTDSASAPAPASALEPIVRQAWAAALGAPVGDRSRDFFALGGTSLQALDAASRLRDALGVSVSLALFFEAPTVAEQADALERMRAQSPDETFAPIPDEAFAVLLNRGAAHVACTPLFCAFGPTKYRDIGLALADVLPVYGLFAQQEIVWAERGDDVGAIPDVSVERLARAYLAAMRRVQPRGPYHLAGFSFGGLVAWEMAQQLARDGDRPELVVLLDTFADRAYERDLARWARHHLAQLFRDWRGYLRTLYREKLAPSSQVAFRVSARAAYVPAPYGGRVLSIRSTLGKGPHYRTRALNGWGPYLRGPFSDHQLPGGHNDVCRPPNAARVAALLRPLLRPNQER